MAEKVLDNSVKDRIPPIFIDDHNTGETYTLDFNRDSVVFAEARGFEIDNVLKFPETGFREIFFLAFRMHHGPKNGNISRTKTDAIYASLGGFSPEFLERLIMLYNQAAQSNNIVETTEEMGKNSNMTVKL